MKKFKSIFATLGVALAVSFLLTMFPEDSQAQTYSYKIIIASQRVPIPGGYIIQDICIHGPGLCGPVTNY